MWGKFSPFVCGVGCGLYSGSTEVCLAFVFPLFQGSIIGVSMTTLLRRGSVLLLFMILTINLDLNGVHFTGVALNGSVNILLATLLFNGTNFAFSASTLGVNFVLFVFYINVRTKPGFFNVFFHSNGRCLLLTLIILLSSVTVAVAVTHCLRVSVNLTANLVTNSLATAPILINTGSTLGANLTNVASPTIVGRLDRDLDINCTVSCLINLIDLVFLTGLVPGLRGRGLTRSSRRVTHRHNVNRITRHGICLPVVHTCHTNPRLVG